MTVLKKMIIALFASMSLLAVIGCEEETPIEKAGEAVEEGAEEAGEAIER